MIEHLPVVDEPEWLSRVDPATIEHTVLPLDDIICDSLYYPASSFDGDPVAYLAGNILSFIYADYSHSLEELDDALGNPGFLGYSVIARRQVTEAELTPRGRIPSLAPCDGDPSVSRTWWQRPPPFYSWNVLQRLEGVPANHGPYRFSFLYLCADGVAAFKALYVENGRVPKAVAIIQPGHGFGCNWTNFTDPGAIFARYVRENPAGQPEHLLYGGARGQHSYTRPCWPAYSSWVCFLGNTSIGVWRRPDQETLYMRLFSTQA